MKLTGTKTDGATIREAFNIISGFINARQDHDR